MNEMDRPGRPGRPQRTRRPLALKVHLLLLTLAVLLPALFAGGLTAWQLGRAYREVVQSALQGGARTLAVTIDREIEVAVTAVSSLAGSRALREFAQAWPQAQDNGTLSDLYQRARAVGEAFGGWVVLVQADGRQVFNTQRPLNSELPVAKGVTWIAQAIDTGAPVVSNLFVGSVAQRRVLAVVVPVDPGLGVPVPQSGVAQPVPAVPLALLLAFDPSRLARLLTYVRDGEIAGLIQVADGTIVARSIGQAEASGQPAPDWVAAPLREREIGLASGSSLEGPPIVAAFHRLDRVPWAVVVTASRAEYQAAWRTPLERLAIGAAALIAAALALAGLLARSLLRPVQALVREAEAVAAAAPPPPPAPPSPVAEFEALRHALARASQATRARAVSEGRAAAAEESAQLLRSERDRARLYFDVAHAVLVVLGPDGTVRSINRHGLLVLGLEEEAQAVGRDWFDSFLPHRLREPVRAVFQDILAGRAVIPGSYENPVLRADGEERLIIWRNTILHDPDGVLIAVVASGEDITERRATEARQVLLMREVDHRAKNALAVVQSILRLTRADGQQDFAAAVEGRVNALARAHTLLARERWGGGDLRELIETELAPYAAAGRLRLDGPAVRLVPDAVQPVSLVLHELATNAAKHGALAAPGGHLEVSWTMRPEGGLRLTWSESGLPTALPGPPQRRGFGSRMIIATVTGQLHGSVTFGWPPAGLRCELLIAPDRVLPVAPEGEWPLAPDGAEPVAPEDAWPMAPEGAGPMAPEGAGPMAPEGAGPMAPEGAWPAAPEGAGPVAPGAGPRHGPDHAPAEEQARRSLRQKRILVVEDEPLVAMDVEAILHGLGCEVVGPAATLAEALRLAEQEAGHLDGAVLDVNLGGHAAFPVANLLVQRDVPVVFATGYSELPGGWTPEGGQGRTALLRKPVDRAALTAALTRLLPPSGQPQATSRAGRRPPPADTLRVCY
ncbi:PAS domain-containing protein [Roseomonas frigidaquae]|uniref:histidine kinase n=1 Tax=Falsiroseomonas frigidaquae TaxID=487318 RepID=A0ABX1ETT0_9PROT|nr:HWE histidine kinase domain-containing protein [Falsiroseomonas frigidaquae]NKE44041.1 PAS domain-containing protein [Falsiroseomonas frigidaquae]